MKKIIFLLFLNASFVILSSFCFAQNKHIDTLIATIKTFKPDTNKVKYLNQLSLSYEYIGDFEKGLKCGTEALELACKLNFKRGVAQASNNIGNIYYNYGSYPKALEYFFMSLKINEELKRKNGIIALLANIGNIYKNQADYSKAGDYYIMALKMAEEQKNKHSIAGLLGNIGGIYEGQKNYPLALDYYLKALKIAEEIEDKNEITILHSNIGGIYQNQGNFSKANDYYFKALKMAEMAGDKNAIAQDLGSIGMLYTATGKFKEAEEYLKKAVSLDDSIGALNELMLIEESLSKLYDTIGLHKQALKYYKKATAVKDSLYSQENKKQLVRKEMNYEFDKKEAETKSANDKQQAVAEEKNRQQKIVIWSVVFGLFLVVVFAAFVFRSLRVTRKQKNIIELQKNEVTKQKDIADSQRIIAVELREISEKQKEIVEEKQKEILDSITYARRIQRALLTSDEYIKNNLPAEHFILFKPKDIVSGDFYWALRSLPAMGGEGRGLFYITAADCTGHGVPGAFMSMLNISYLNENVIERGISMPNEILDAQRAEIIKSLNPPGSTEISKDGMDCILCAYDFDKMLLHFAAANNPLWLVRNSELIEYKADKMPVGKYTEEMLPFTLQTIALQKGDVVYTSTDGFADQFGASGKKMMKKKFKEELLKIHHQPMAEQKEYLNQFFENWKGNSEQVDDVCVIGVRI